MHYTQLQRIVQSHRLINVLKESFKYMLGTMKFAFQITECVYKRFNSMLDQMVFLDNYIAIFRHYQLLFFN